MVWLTKWPMRRHGTMHRNGAMMVMAPFMDFHGAESVGTRTQLYYKINLFVRTSYNTSLLSSIRKGKDAR